MTTEKTPGYRPTPFPEILSTVFTDVTKRKAEREGLLANYTRSLSTWSNTEPFPEKGQYWKQNSTGVIHRIVAVAHHGVRDQQNILHVIHETQDGAVFSTEIGPFLCGKVDYSIAVHDYGDEIQEAPEFELTDQNWDDSIPEVPKRQRPLTDAEAREHLAKGPVNLWVVNTMRTQHGVPEILIECPMEFKSVVVVKIPDTWLPVNIIQQVPVSALLNNASFLRLLSKGHIRIIRKKLARDVLTTDEAKAEQLRLISRGVNPSNIGAVNTKNEAV